jgi:hypothetical protein
MANDWWNHVARANVRDFNPLGTGGTTNDGSISASSMNSMKTLTSELAGFTAATVPSGTPILVVGAGPDGSNLVTTATYASSTTVTLAQAASTPVSGATIVWGPDDSQAIANAISAMSAAGGAVVFPPGVYVVGTAAPVTAPSNVRVTFEEGAMIAAFGTTVTLNGRIAAHPTQQIFGGVGFLGSPGGSGLTVGGNPIGTVQWKVQITSTSPLQFQYSTDDGASYFTDLDVPTSSPYQYVIPGTGMTLIFGGTYTAGQSWSWTSTSAISLTALAADMFQVKWFGATGDGTTDDTAAIQATIAAASQVPRGPLQAAGPTVFLPSGTYSVTAPANGVALAITTAIQLTGAGQGSVLSVNGPGTGLLVEGGGADYSEIDSLALYGNPSQPPLDLIVVHSSYVGIQDVALTYAARYGLLIESNTEDGALYGVTLSPPGTQMLADQFTLNGIYGSVCPWRNGQVTTTSTAFTQPAVNASTTTPVTVGSTAALGTPGAATSPFVVLGAEALKGGGLYSVAIESDTSMTLTNLGNVTAAAVGSSVPSGTTVQIGALVCCHGADSHAGVATMVNAIDCNISIIEASEGGNTWIQCYSQVANTGYVVASTDPSLFLNCVSEDLPPGEDVLHKNALVAFPDRGPSMFVGGALAMYAAIIPAGASPATGYASDGTESIGSYLEQGFSGLSFSRVGQDGATYRAQIPCAPHISGPLNIGRTANGVASDWYLAYEFNGPKASAPFPYEQNSYIWKHWTNGQEDPVDPYTGAFGMTDTSHPRGVGLPMVAAPTMNTQRRWSWTQPSITLYPPTPEKPVNTVYMKGGNVLDGGSDLGWFDFADPGTEYWPNALSRVSVTLHFDSVTDMQNAGQTSVNGYTMVPHGVGQEESYNIACSITVAAECTATLVWHFELFVQNYDTGSGDYG